MYCFSRIALGGGVADAAIRNAVHGGLPISKARTMAAENATRKKPLKEEAVPHPRVEIEQTGTISKRQKHEGKRF
jgi:hypothetical protein